MSSRALNPSPVIRIRSTGLAGALQAAAEGKGFSTTGVPDSNPEPLRTSPPDQTQRRDRRGLHRVERPCSLIQRLFRPDGLHPSSIGAELLSTEDHHSFVHSGGRVDVLKTDPLSHR
ncbi:hypothetical protein AMELA_G00085990 [Ameiurus melas]|uniref:Uncharacterized protein n=1 Tax=Ameiurus melas TaxID=219545 RepID=A0A7J6AXE2_AMEME|nr:hypothetical protein AMELA_G00085990 [Ameiurus melas]